MVPIAQCKLHRKAPVLCIAVYTLTVYFRLTTEVLNNCLNSLLTHWQNYKCLYGGLNLQYTGLRNSSLHCNSSEGFRGNLWGYNLERWGCCSRDYLMHVFCTFSIFTESFKSFSTLILFSFSFPIRDCVSLVLSLSLKDAIWQKYLCAKPKDTRPVLAGIESGIVANLTSAVRRSNHSARSHPD